MPSRTPFAVPFSLLAAAITVGAREPVPSTATEDVERVAFAPSLAVDLARCERLASGVYRRDLQVGAGDSVRTAATLTLRRPCDGPTGSVVSADAGTAQLQWRPGTFLPGIAQGLRGMRAGGRRQLLIPAAPATDGRASKGAQLALPLILDLELVAVSERGQVPEPTRPSRAPAYWERL